MGGDYEGFGVGVPKGEEPVAVAVVECSELPDVGVFQFFEEFIVHDTVFYLLVVVGYFFLDF